MSRPKVSIIVPIYNAEQYLDECLNSLKRQTLEDIEIIMCDNASTDKSRHIMKKYADDDSRFKCVLQERNMGQGYNMIAGLAAANGDYIAECDADDFADLHMYEKLYTIAAEYDCEVAQCGWVDFSSVNAVTRRMVECDCVIRVKDLDEHLQANILGYQPHIMSAIYNRVWVIENGLWYRSTGSYQDTSMSFKIKALANHYAVTSECLYWYRKDNTSAGTYTDMNVAGVCEQYEEIERWNNEHKLVDPHIVGTLKYYTYMWQFNRLPMKDKLFFFEMAQREFKRDTVKRELFLNDRDWNNYCGWRDTPVISQKAL